MPQPDTASCGPPPEDVARLEEVVNRFEDAWQRGERPVIDEHLSGDGGLRFLLLVELVHVELENRVKAEEAARVEEYLRRYPELGRDRAVVLELVAAEWQQRRRRDPGVTTAEYLERFPEYRAELLVSATASLPPSASPDRWPEADSTQCLPPEGSSTADPAGGKGPSPGDPAGGVVTRSRYHVLRLHACGGLGEVLAARDDVLNREVAVKRLLRRRAHDPESRGRFLREAEITGQLEHPGVVPVYGLGQAADGSPCYAMRLIRGETFQEAAERFHRDDRPGRDPGERSLAFRQLLQRFQAVCQALAYAHNRGILHRDVKPANVMLGRYGETLVVDWGLAKAQGRDDKHAISDERALHPRSGSGSAATQYGSAIGTPAYMSREQAAGRLDELGPASDVYSLGATLYCVLTGQPPFARDDVGTLLGKVKVGEFHKPRFGLTEPRDSAIKSIREWTAIPAVGQGPSKKAQSQTGSGFVFIFEPYGARPQRPLRIGQRLVIIEPTRSLSPSRMALGACRCAGGMTR
jgi:eukaryotic-like serine/threonine-protein kinase